MSKTIKIGKLSIPMPIVALSLMVMAVSATTYATMVGYLYVNPKPTAIWLSPTYYDMTVYSGTVNHQLATIVNQIENQTFEITTEIDAYYYDKDYNYNDMSPYVHVTYLDYDTRTPLPDADADGNPEIFAPVGDTLIYVEIIIDDIPDLNYGNARIETSLEA